MKKLLMRIAAGASLLFTAGGALAFHPPGAPIWNGFYIGVQGGSGWGTSELNEKSFNLCLAGAPGVCVGPPAGFPVVANSATASYGLNGWHGGLTVGWNTQASGSPFVFGVEADISRSNIDGKGDCTSAASANFAFALAQTGCHTRLNWFSTFTGRIGFAVDHALLYVKGGVAWARFDHDMTAAIIPGIPVIPGPVASLGDNRFGPTAGVGVEYRFLSNWSAKLEYDYMDFGSKNLHFVSAPFAGLLFVHDEADRERVHVVRAGLNYRWGAPSTYPLK